MTIGPCCPGKTATKKIRVGSHSVGISELDLIIAKALENEGASDADIKRILMKELKAHNYVPGPVEDGYSKGIWEAYLDAKAARDSRRQEEARDSYHGIPRSEIQWFPKVDYDLCSNCGKCIEFCHRGVYTCDDGPRVTNPYSCIVSCTGCASLCPEKAISFPSLVELREDLKALRKRYGIYKG